MRLTNKTTYAAAALAVLAYRQTHGVATSTVQDLAGQLSMSVSYLETLFSTLKKAGLVEASRGPGGGYKLTRSPADVRVLDLARLVETDGLQEGGITGKVYALIEDAVAEALSHISIHELAHSSGITIDAGTVRVAVPSKEADPCRPAPGVYRHTLGVSGKHQRPASLLAGVPNSVFALGSAPAAE